MRSVSQIALFSLLALAVTMGAAHADTRGLAQSFDWQSTKGSYLTSWGTIPDEKIIADRHTIKKSINDTVSPSLCGIGNTDYNAIKTYAIDFNGDGYPDYVLDEYAYFIKGQSANCPVRICDDINNNGTAACTIALFRNLGTPTQILTASTATTDTSTKSDGGKTAFTLKACPATAKDNVACRSDCPATPDQCPALFTYSMEVNMSRPVFSWTFIPVANYAQFRNGRLNVYGDPMYHVPYNNNPVFVATVGNAYCTDEEMSGNVCLKYYQFVAGSIAGKSDTFVDMYDPIPQLGDPENDARMTPTLYDRSAVLTDDLWRQSAQGSVLEANSEVAIQIPNYTGKGGAEDLLCRQITNTSKVKYLMPQHTDEEIDSFLKAITAGNLSGVTQKTCEHKFTDWYGTTTCPAMSCDETRKIAAERRCQRSSSAYGDCSECADIDDPNPIADYPTNQCTFSKLCAGPPCPPHHSCFPAGTEITMADGSYKPIEQVAIGDRVMGFSRQAPLSPLHEARVKELAITDSSDLLWVNALQVTPGHTFLLASGLTVPARAIKLGDILVGTSGEQVLVSKVGPVGAKAKVYNLVLEAGSEGYVAGGVRVMMYPDEAE